MKKDLNKDVDSKNSKGRIALGIVLIFAILFVIIIGYTIHSGGTRSNKSSTSNSSNVDNHFNYDYKYVLQTTFGSEYFIYLLNDDSVKVVGKIPVYRVCEDQDCLQQETDEFNYEETNIEFSEKSMDKVIEFISSFFDKKLTNYLNLETVSLTQFQKRMELALLLNSEDMVTFEESLIFGTESKQLKNSTGKTIFKNSKTTIAFSNNEIVNNIGVYLNAIVEDEWLKLEEECKDLISGGLQVSEEEKPGITYSLKLENLDVFSISFTYSMTGSLGGVPWGDEKGFVFNSATGEIKEYPSGWKTASYEKVLEALKKSDEYKNITENLKTDWETILKENMFNVGNWYLKDESIIFLIPESLIADSSLSSHVIEIEIENTFGDF